MNAQPMSVHEDVLDPADQADRIQRVTPAPSSALLLCDFLREDAPMSCRTRRTRSTSEVEHPVSRFLSRRIRLIV